MKSGLAKFLNAEPRTDNVGDMVYSLPSAQWCAFGEGTQILSVSARSHHWNGAGPLSIKCFFNGEAVYRAGRGVYRVQQSSYLLLNRGQHYEISIERARPTESFCVFFAPGLIEAAAHSLAAGTARLLDEPQRAANKQIYFFERLYPANDGLFEAIARMRRQLQRLGSDSGWLEERVQDLAGDLLRAHVRECQKTEQLDALRPGVREELYRRLYRARDYAASLFAEPLSLRQLCHIACLSTNHFLRTFKALFGQTPHQFITQRRLEAARELLRTTEQSVTDVCLAVGFESLGSFSSRYQRYFGVPPSHHQKGDFREAARSRSR